MTTTARAHEITTAAEQLFGRQGYHATTIRQVAGALDLQGGSLYAHVSSKEALLAAVVERSADRFDSAMSAALDCNDDPSAQLRHAVAAHVGVITENLPAATVYFQDWRHVSTPRLRRLRHRRDAYEQRWRDLIQTGVGEGHFGCTDVDMAARLCLSTCNWVYQWFRPDGELTADTVAEQIAGLLLDGLRPASRPSIEESTK